MERIYYQCPNCGHLQRSLAKKKIKCHKCGKIYDVSKARKVRKNQKEEGFFRFNPTKV